MEFEIQLGTPPGCDHHKLRLYCKKGNGNNRQSHSIGPVSLRTNADQLLQFQKAKFNNADAHVLIRRSDDVGFPACSLVPGKKKDVTRQ